jgi:hypothetical protein
MDIAVGQIWRTRGGDHVEVTHKSTIAGDSFPWIGSTPSGRGVTWTHAGTYHLVGGDHELDLMELVHGKAIEAADSLEYFRQIMFPGWFPS